MSTQSVLTQIPENTSFLQKTKFTFVIPELPFARYFCQSVNLPGVSTTEINIPTPFSDTYRHGDKLQYEALAMTILIDEDLRVWEETYNWLKSLTFPHRYSEYVKNSRNKEPYYDGVLTINTNANIPNMRIKFTHIHPVSLSGIDFSAATSADETPTCTVSFRYDTFIIERL